MNILVTGGAGYKGSKLTTALLKEGHWVTVLDNFMFGFEPLLHLVAHPRLTILVKDVRAMTGDDVKHFDVIYHLAALSGMPYCTAYPRAAREINVTATKRLIKLLAPAQLLVYASTTSLYGASGTLRDETSPVTTASLYGKTKYQAESAVMQRQNSISLRFATLFGISPRMRTDLLVNNFVYRAVTERTLVLFDANSVRTYLHIDDAISAYLMLLRQRKMVGEIFNVGSSSLNFTKRGLATSIKKHIPLEIIGSQLNDIDRRSYLVSYAKIDALGYEPKITLDQGIRELVKLYTVYDPYRPFPPI